MSGFAHQEHLFLERGSSWVLRTTQEDRPLSSIPTHEFRPGPLTGQGSCLGGTERHAHDTSELHLCIQFPMYWSNRGLGRGRETLEELPGWSNYLTISRLPTLYKIIFLQENRLPQG